MAHQEPAPAATPSPPALGAAAAVPALSIAAVERDTGIGKDTLRVWERRYGFPLPLRSANGERSYPQSQIDQLRLLRRLIDAGHRPGKIVGLGLPALEQLSVNLARPPNSPSWVDQPQLDAYLALIKQHDLDALRASLGVNLERMGLALFVHRLVAPLNAMVGTAWQRGELEIFEEHFYTEAIQTVLRNAISALAASAPNAGNAGNAPRVLLTTVPQEGHGLGLLMAEAMLALEGCKCQSLGTQTPIADIVRAARSQRADVVALSFTGTLAGTAVLAALAELRGQLPASVNIWTGGACPALQRKALDGVRTLAGLLDIPVAVRQWRDAATAAAA